MSAADEQGEERATRKSAPDLRLPGSVAEILASPAGPKVGAFFDLDGTLVAGFTAVILTQESCGAAIWAWASCSVWFRPA